MELGEILIIGFTGAVAVSTVAYAVLTWRLVSETSRLREAQTEPRVSVRVELAENMGHGAMELIVRNEGQGPAQNIRFSFEGDPTYFTESGLGQPIDEVSAIKNGLPYLGPSQQFRILLGWLFGDAFHRANKEPWTFHIEFENVAGNSRRDTYTLDFSQFAGLIVGDGPPLVRIEKHLEKLQRDVGHLSTGFRKLQVLTQPKEEFDRQRAEALREHRERQAANSSDVSSTTGEEDTSSA